MMYPFMTLDDNTEVVHSEMLPDGRVKVYFESRMQRTASILLSAISRIINGKTSTALPRRKLPGIRSLWNLQLI